MSKGFAIVLLAAFLTWGLDAAGQNAPPPNGSPPPNAVPPASPPEKPVSITAILDSSARSSPVGLNEQLLVQVVNGESPPKPIAKLDASKYALFFNGREVKGLADPIYDQANHGLLFELKRNDKNKDLWTSLLGSPWPTEFTRLVKVSLGERPIDGKSVLLSTISAGADSANADTLNLVVLPPWRLAIAIVFMVGLIWLVWWRARRDATLRDNLLPQIESKCQTYSLGRWQMAFWFTLIFCSFVFLFLLTWDYNTIGAQALTLMGISGGTALAAVAVDAAKDSPADAVNRGLRALGLTSYDDVVRVRQEIIDREGALSLAERQLATLAALPAPTPEDQLKISQLQQDIPKLNTEILGRRGILRTYDDQTRPFRTHGWFRDLTTDLNGTAIHRLQVFCWTLVLGVVYLIGVYRDLTMPEFSSQLLALMAISGAGYVGFKYPEKNI